MSAFCGTRGRRGQSWNGCRRWPGRCCRCRSGCCRRCRSLGRQRSLRRFRRRGRCWLYRWSRRRLRSVRRHRSGRTRCQGGNSSWRKCGVRSGGWVRSWRGNRLQGGLNPASYGSGALRERGQGREDWRRCFTHDFSRRWSRRGGSRGACRSRFTPTGREKHQGSKDSQEDHQQRTRGSASIQPTVMIRVYSGHALHSINANPGPPCRVLDIKMVNFRSIKQR